MPDQTYNDISNLFNALQVIAGKDKISGGPTLDANGNVIIQPHTGSSGWLGKSTRDRADSLNREFLSKVYELQNEARNRIKIQELVNSGNLDAETLRGIVALQEQSLANQGIIQNTKTQAEEARMTKDAGVIADTLAKNGIIPDKNSIASYSNSVNPNLIANLANLAGLQARASADPSMRQIAKQGLQASLYAPVVDNIYKLRTPVDANSSVALFGGTGDYEGTFNGPLQQQEIDRVINPITGAEEDAKVKNSYSGSSYNRTPTKKAKRLAENAGNAGNAFSGLSSSTSNLSQPTNFNSFVPSFVSPQYQEKLNSMMFNPKGLGEGQSLQSSDIFKKFVEFIEQHPELRNEVEALGSNRLQYSNR